MSKQYQWPENSLRWLFLFAIAISAFTPISLIVMTVCGVLVVLLPSSWPALKRLFSVRLFWLVLLLFVVVLLHSFGFGVSHHAVMRSVRRWFVFIPMLFMGVLFLDALWQRRSMNALLVCGLLLGLVTVFSQVLAWHVSQGHVFFQHWIMNHVLFKKLIVEAVERHLQGHAVLLGLVAALFFYRGIVEFRRNGIRSTLATLYCFAFLMLLVAVIGQPERVGYLTLIVLMLIIFYQHFSLKGRVIGVSFLAVFLMAAYFLPLSQSFRPRVNQLFSDIVHFKVVEPTAKSNLSDNGNRLEGYYIGIKNMMLRPLWGYGTGSIHDSQKAMVYNWASIENSFLMAALELGLVGMLLLIWVLYKQWCLFSTLDDSDEIEGRLAFYAVLIGSFTCPFLYMGLGLVILFTCVTWAMGFNLAQCRDR